MPQFGGKEADSARRERRREWTYVGLMMVCILLTLPIAPVLWRTALKISEPLVNASGYIAFLLIFVGAFAYLIRRGRETNSRGLVATAGFGLVYFLLLKYQCHNPAERFHLIEYGVLAYLAYRAFRLDFSETKAYVLSFLLSSGFGFFDEIVQYILPNRVYETRDAMTNALAAAVGLMVVKVLVRPDSSGVASDEAER